MKLPSTVLACKIPFPPSSARWMPERGSFLRPGWRAVETRQVEKRLQPTASAQRAGSKRWQLGWQSGHWSRRSRSDTPNQAWFITHIADSNMSVRNTWPSWISTAWFLVWAGQQIRMTTWA